MAKDIKFPKKVFSGKGEINPSFRTTNIMVKALDIAAETNSTTRSGLINFILDQWLQIQLEEGNSELRKLIDDAGEV